MRKVLIAAAAALLGVLSAIAQAEPLKVAISQRGFWDSSFVEFAEAAGRCAFRRSTPTVRAVSGGMQIARARCDLRERGDTKMPGEIMTVTAHGCSFLAVSLFGEDSPLQMDEAPAAERAEDEERRKDR